MKNLSVNWRTTAVGVIAIALTAIKYFDPSLMTTEAYTEAIGVLGALGFVVAKDGTVTGNGDNATSKTK